ncbi:MAG: hypothetical protein MJK18_12715 [Bdellovibrionales bacterium]|nr:hypothetical protein [Bdellovibrionales bacterium]
MTTCIVYIIDFSELWVKTALLTSFQVMTSLAPNQPTCSSVGFNYLGAFLFKVKWTFVGNVSEL